MVKAANVRLIHVEKRLGGRLVTVVVEGSVSDVTAALEAGKAAAAEVGNVKLAEVIARPHPDVMSFLTTG
jgi:microcompartment protein CcmL/EutN